jgi:hypothetical protein
MMPPEAYSVLMPLAPWEDPAVLHVALRSICDQSLAAQRVVISCDGEPSEALGAVLRESELPIRKIVGPGGEGVGPVLARGLRICESELVMRADADDISFPDRAREQVAVMQQRSELAVISSPIVEFVKENHLLRQRAVPHGVGAVSRFLAWRNPINHPAVMFRKSSVLAAGSYMDCPGFEDYHLWLRLHARGELLDNLSQPLVAVRIGDAHLARRRGLAYLNREASFLLLCGREGLLPRHQVLLLILLRCPIRLLPRSMVKIIFHSLLRISHRE